MQHKWKTIQNKTFRITRNIASRCFWWFFLLDKGTNRRKALLALQTSDVWGFLPAKMLLRAWTVGRIHFSLCPVFIQDKSSEWFWRVTVPTRFVSEHTRRASHVSTNRQGKTGLLDYKAEEERIPWTECFKTFLNEIFQKCTRTTTEQWHKYHWWTLIILSPKLFYFHCYLVPPPST